MKKTLIILITLITSCTFNNSYVDSDWKINKLIEFQYYEDGGSIAVKYHDHNHDIKYISCIRQFSDTGLTPGIIYMGNKPMSGKKLIINSKEEKNLRQKIIEAYDKGNYKKENIVEGVDYFLKILNLETQLRKSEERVRLSTNEEW